MGIGFIEGRLRTGGSAANRGPQRRFLVAGVEIDTIVGRTAIRPPRRTRNPRAAYIIPGGKRGLRAKPGGGTTESTPTESKSSPGDMGAYEEEF